MLAVIAALLGQLSDNWGTCNRRKAFQNHLHEKTMLSWLQIIEVTGKNPPYGNLSFSYRLVLLLSRNKTQKTVIILQFKDHISLEYGPANLVSVI